MFDNLQPIDVFRNSIIKILRVTPGMNISSVPISEYVVERMEMIKKYPVSDRPYSWSFPFVTG